MVCSVANDLNHLIAGDIIGTYQKKAMHAARRGEEKRAWHELLWAGYAREGVDPRYGL